MPTYTKIEFNKLDLFRDILVDILRSSSTTWPKNAWNDSIVSQTYDLAKTVAHNAFIACPGLRS